MGKQGLRYGPVGLSFDDLKKAAIDRLACMRCGACVTVCPTKAISIEPDTSQPAKLVGECIDCGLCVAVCPFVEGWGSPQVKPLSEFLEIFVAKSARPSSAFQDGGVVSALLEAGLKEGLVDACLVTGKDAKNWIGKAVFVADPLGVKRFAGTLYWQVPVFTDLLEAVEKGGYSKIAVVGMPCRIAASKLMEETMPELEGKIALRFGLFCSESFDRERFMNAVAEITSTDVGKVAKIDIKGKVVITLFDGSIYTAKLGRFKQYANDSCSLCRDYTAELADISVGAVGSPRVGSNVVIVRSLVGKRIVDKACDSGFIVRSDDLVDVKVLTRLAVRKKVEGQGKDVVERRPVRVLCG